MSRLKIHISLDEYETGDAINRRKGLSESFDVKLNWLIWNEASHFSKPSKNSPLELYYTSTSLPIILFLLFKGRFLVLAKMTIPHLADLILLLLNDLFWKSVLPGGIFLNHFLQNWYISKALVWTGIFGLKLVYFDIFIDLVWIWYIWENFGILLENMVYWRPKKFWKKILMSFFFLEKKNFFLKFSTFYQKFSSGIFLVWNWSPFGLETKKKPGNTVENFWRESKRQNANKWWNFNFELNFPFSTGSANTRTF